MVSRARGRVTNQSDLAASWQGTGAGFALEDTAKVLGGTHLSLDSTAPGNISHLRVLLGDGVLIVAQVFAAELDKVLLRMAQPPASPHGRLCAAQYGQLHAIVLVGADREGFWYLDPYFHVAGQPFYIAATEFVHVFQGAVVFA